MQSNVTKWFFIDLTLPEGNEFTEEEIKDVLDKNRCSFKFIIKHTIIFELSNQPETIVLKELEKHFYDLVLLNTDDVSDEFNFKAYEAEEILFSFFIKSEKISEDEFVSYLARVQDSQIEQYDTEYKFISDIDYSVNNYSNVPLIHNIRCRNIAVFTLKTITFGIAFIGYMRIGESIKVTVKTFRYDMLKYLTEKFSELFEEIIWEDNINWKWLISRKVSTGYRENKKHITNNVLMKSFLKMTCSNDAEGNIKHLMKKLLDKGYLDFEEYGDISKNKKIIKYLQPYTRVLKSNLPNKGLWIDTSTGLIFSENESNNPERINEIYNLQQVFSAPHHLLHYIRAYWHQDYVEQIFRIVSENFNKRKEAKIQIVELITDTQFDLKRSGEPKESSRDIDLLLRVKNLETNNEQIIAVEAKRNANEFNTVRSDIETKISQRYAEIFTGFIAVAYFDNRGLDGKSEVVTWGGEENSLTRRLFLCANTDKDKLEQSITETILKVCGLDD